MARKKILRRILWPLGGAFLLILILAATFPYWISLAVRPLSARYNLSYEKYDRVGFDKFALENVTYKTAGVDFKASRIEGYLPSSWYWKATHRGTNEPPTFLKINGWKAIVKGKPS